MIETLHQVHYFIAQTFYQNKPNKSVCEMFAFLYRYYTGENPQKSNHAPFSTVHMFCVAFMVVLKGKNGSAMGKGKPYIANCNCHSTKKPVTTMLTYPWKCTVLHCNYLGNTWKPLVLMTQHFDYCPSSSEHGDNQSVRSSAPVVSRCFPGGYNVKLYISRGRLAWWLLAFLHNVCVSMYNVLAYLLRILFAF